VSGPCDKSNALSAESRYGARNGRRDAAVALVGGLLCLLPIASWKGLYYAHYLGGALFQCVVLLFIPLWAWRSGTHGARDGRTALAGWLLWGYAIFSLCSAAWAPSLLRRLAFVASVSILFHVLWALLLGRLLDARRDLRTALRAIFSAGLLAALVALGYVAVAFADHVRRMPDTSVLDLVKASLPAVQRVLGHRNFLAIYLLPGCVLAAAELAAPRVAGSRGNAGPLGLPKPLVTAGGVLLLLGLAISCSIGGWMGLAVGLLFLLSFRLGRRWRWTIAVGGASLALGGLVVLSLDAVEARTAAIAQLQRWFLWKGAGRMALEHPLLGWGTGMFLPRFAEFKPTAPMRHNLLTMITLHPHNELLLVTVEGGLVGLGLYVSALFVGLGDALRCGGRESDVGWRFTVWALGGAFAAMFVQGLVTVSLRFWAPAALYWTLVGLMLAVRWEGPALHSARNGASGGQPGAAGPLLRAVRVGAATVAAAAVFVGVVWSGARAEWLLGGAYPVVTVRKPDGTEARVRRRVEFIGPFRRRTRPTSPEEYASDMQRAARLSRYVPDYFKTFEKRGMAWEAARRPDKAIEVYSELEAEAPGYGRVRRRLGSLYLARAKEEENAERRADLYYRAFEWFEKALDQNPYDHDSRLGAVEVLLRASGRNLPRAIDYLRFISDPRNGGPSEAVRGRALGLVVRARSLYGEDNPEWLSALEEIERRLREGPPR